MNGVCIRQLLLHDKSPDAQGLTTAHVPYLTLSVGRGPGLAPPGTVHGRSQDAGGAAVSSEAGLGRGPPPTGRFSACGPSGLPGRGLSAWLRLRALGPSPNGSSQRTACFSHACRRESPSKTDARIGPGGDVTAVATRRWLEASRGPIHSRGAGQMRCEPRRQGPRELSATVAGPSVRRAVCITRWMRQDHGPRAPASKPLIRPHGNPASSALARPASDSRESQIGEAR